MLENQGAAHDQMTGERTAAFNALVTLLRLLDLGFDAPKPVSASQIYEVSRWHAQAEEIAVATTRSEAVHLAKRVISLGLEIAANNQSITDLLQSSVPLAGWGQTIPASSGNTLRHRVNRVYDRRLAEEQPSARSDDASNTASPVTCRTRPA